jgi:predicted Zn-ribbon and HTH transcriptional regulator
MSVIESIKETIGLAEDGQRYECQSCGHTFRTDADPSSRWYSCPECDGDDIEPAESSQA